MFGKKEDGPKYGPQRTAKSAENITAGQVSIQNNPIRCLAYRPTKTKFQASTIYQHFLCPYKYENN